MLCQDLPRSAIPLGHHPSPTSMTTSSVTAKTVERNIVPTVDHRHHMLGAFVLHSPAAVDWLHVTSVEEAFVASPGLRSLLQASLSRYLAVEHVQTPFSEMQSIR